MQLVVKAKLADCWQCCHWSISFLSNEVMDETGSVTRDQPVQRKAVEKINKKAHMCPKKVKGEKVNVVQARSEDFEAKSQLLWRSFFLSHT